MNRIDLKGRHAVITGGSGQSLLDDAAVVLAGVEALACPSSDRRQLLLGIGPVSNGIGQGARGKRLEQAGSA